MGVGCDEGRVAGQKVYLLIAAKASKDKIQQTEKPDSAEGLPPVWTSLVFRKPPSLTNLRKASPLVTA
ncbi:hypothetical protein NL676_001356 [Syzygium grande]|nr:hypothetical protein NL676_001356 [Syzygium grande]